MTESEAARAGEDDPRELVPMFGNDVTLLGARRAVVAQIWVYNHDSKESHHVLSEVDLVQDEVPRVDAQFDWRERLGKKSRWSVHAESEVIPAEQALEWYDGVVRTGDWAPVWRDVPLTAPLPLRNTLEEPRWPSLVKEHESTAVPLAARRTGGTRMHHILCEGDLLQSILTEKELGVMVELVKDNRRFDFSSVPELLQSVHFFQPLPLLRYVGTRLDTDSEGNDRSVLIDIVPRLGASLDGLEIEILEQRSTGERVLARFRPSGVLYRLPLAEEIGRIRTRVVHDELGLLVDEGPFAFLRGISTTLKLQTRERRVALPARRDRPARLIRIGVSEGEPMVISQGGESRPASRILHSVGARLKAQSVPKESERWFLGDRNTAEEALRQILGLAEDLALIVDPYFSATEVREWLPSIATVRAKVQVLTSASGLRGGSLDSSSAGANEKERKQLKLLDGALKADRAAGQINETEVRVMVGQQSPIHDRFVVADQRVWLMGSSLNSFGLHGTMLVQLRRPSEVLAVLVREWDRAAPVADRLAQLKKNAVRKPSL